jgi:predicted transcriptional regulator
MVADLTERLFAGSPMALVTHLVSRHEIDPAELSELERMITKAKRREGKR